MIIKISPAPISSNQTLSFVLSIYHRLLVLLCLFVALTLIDLNNALEHQEISRTITTISTTNTQIVKFRRPDICRENLLSRKASELPALVITGRIKEVYLTNLDTQQPLTINHLSVDTLGPLNNATNQRALVTINRVLKGSQDLVDSDIIVSGFNGTNASPCPNSIKPNDTWIMLLDQEADRRYTIQGQNLISLNLANLDRINAIAADEPLKRRPNIDDILCEAHYCAYGRCRVKVDENISKPESGLTLTVTNKSVECHCPDSCPPLPNPICGSDNATYTNECHLIREGCRLKKPLFVTKLYPC